MSVNRIGVEVGCCTRSMLKKGEEKKSPENKKTISSPNKPKEVSTPRKVKDNGSLVVTVDKVKPSTPRSVKKIGSNISKEVSISPGPLTRAKRKSLAVVKNFSQIFEEDIKVSPQKRRKSPIKNIDTVSLEKKETETNNNVNNNIVELVNKRNFEDLKVVIRRVSDAEVDELTGKSCTAPAVKEEDKTSDRNMKQKAGCDSNNDNLDKCADKKEGVDNEKNNTSGNKDSIKSLSDSLEKVKVSTCKENINDIALAQKLDVKPKAHNTKESVTEIKETIKTENIKCIKTEGGLGGKDTSHTPDEPTGKSICTNKHLEKGNEKTEIKTQQQKDDKIVPETVKCPVSSSTCTSSLKESPRNVKETKVEPVSKNSSINAEGSKLKQTSSEKIEEDLDLARPLDSSEEIMSPQEFLKDVFTSNVESSPIKGESTEVLVDKQSFKPNSNIRIKNKSNNVEDKEGPDSVMTKETKVNTSLKSSAKSIEKEKGTDKTENVSVKSPTLKESAVKEMNKTVVKEKTVAKTEHVSVISPASKGNVIKDVIKSAEKEKPTSITEKESIKSPSPNDSVIKDGNKSVEKEKKIGKPGNVSATSPPSKGSDKEDVTKSVEKEKPIDKTENVSVKSPLLKDSAKEGVTKSMEKEKSASKTENVSVKSPLLKSSDKERETKSAEKEKPIGKSGNIPVKSQTPKGNDKDDLMKSAEKVKPVDKTENVSIKSPVPKDVNKSAEKEKPVGKTGNIPVKSPAPKGNDKDDLMKSAEKVKPVGKTENISIKSPVPKDVNKSAQKEKPIGKSDNISIKSPVLKDTVTEDMNKSAQKEKPVGKTENVSIKSTVPKDVNKAAEKEKPVGKTENVSIKSPVPKDVNKSVEKEKPVGKTENVSIKSPVPKDVNKAAEKEKPVGKTENVSIKSPVSKDVNKSAEKEKPVGKTENVSIKSPVSKDVNKSAQKEKPVGKSDNISIKSPVLKDTVTEDMNKSAQIEKQAGKTENVSIKSPVPKDVNKSAEKEKPIDKSDNITIKSPVLKDTVTEDMNKSAEKEKQAGKTEKISIKSPVLKDNVTIDVNKSAEKEKPIDKTEKGSIKSPVPKDVNKSAEKKKPDWKNIDSNILTEFANIPKFDAFGEVVKDVNVHNDRIHKDIKDLSLYQQQVSSADDNLEGTDNTIKVNRTNKQDICQIEKDDNCLSISDDETRDAKEFSTTTGDAETLYSEIKLKSNSDVQDVSGSCETVTESTKEVECDIETNESGVFKQSKTVSIIDLEDNSMMSGVEEIQEDTPDEENYTDDKKGDFQKQKSVKSFARSSEGNNIENDAIDLCSDSESNDAEKNVIDDVVKGIDVKEDYEEVGKNVDENEEEERLDEVEENKGSEENNDKSEENAEENIDETCKNVDIPSEIGIQKNKEAKEITDDESEENVEEDKDEKSRNEETPSEVEQEEELVVETDRSESVEDFEEAQFSISDIGTDIEDEDVVISGKDFIYDEAEECDEEIQGEDYEESSDECDEDIEEDPIVSCTDFFDNEAKEDNTFYVSENSSDSLSIEEVSLNDLTKKDKASFPVKTRSPKKENKVVAGKQKCLKVKDTNDIVYGRCIKFKVKNISDIEELSDDKGKSRTTKKTLNEGKYQGNWLVTSEAEIKKGNEINRLRKTSKTSNKKTDSNVTVFSTRNCEWVLEENVSVQIGQSKKLKRKLERESVDHISVPNKKTPGIPVESTSYLEKEILTKVNSKKNLKIKKDVKKREVLNNQGVQVDIERKQTKKISKTIKTEKDLSEKVADSVNRKENFSETKKIRSSDTSRDTKKKDENFGQFIINEIPMNGKKDALKKRTDNSDKFNKTKLIKISFKATSEEMLPKVSNEVMDNFQKVTDLFNRSDSIGIENNKLKIKEKQKVLSAKNTEKLSPLKTNVSLNRYPVTVGNLPNRCSSRGIRKSFSTVGIDDIIDISSISDNPEMRLTVVTFSSKESQLKALNSYGNIILHGKPLFTLKYHENDEKEMINVTSEAAELGDSIDNQKSRSSIVKIRGSKLKKRQANIPSDVEKIDTFQRNRNEMFSKNSGLKNNNSATNKRKKSVCDSSNSVSKKIARDPEGTDRKPCAKHDGPSKFPEINNKPKKHEHKITEEVKECDIPRQDNPHKKTNSLVVSCLAIRRLTPEKVKEALSKFDILDISSVENISKKSVIVTFTSKASVKKAMGCSGEINGKPLTFERKHHYHDILIERSMKKKLMETDESKNAEKSRNQNDVATAIPTTTTAMKPKDCTSDKSPSKNDGIFSLLIKNLPADITTTRLKKTLGKRGIRGITEVAFKRDKSNLEKPLTGIITFHKKKYYRFALKPKDILLNGTEIKFQPIK